MKKLTILFIMALLVISLISGEEALKNYLFYKEISTGSDSKYKSFFLDEEVYKYSKSDLSDLRIINKDKAFVPFYIVRGTEEINQEESTYKTKRIFTRSMKKEQIDFFDFQVLPPDKKVVAKKLILHSSSKDFSKRVGVHARNITGDWEFLKDDTIYNFDKYKKLEIQLDNDKAYSFFSIQIVENPEKISIDGMDVIYSSKEVSFKNYKKNMNLKYQIKQKDKSTFITIDNENKLNIVKLEFNINGIFKRECYIYKDDKYENYSVERELYQFDFKDTKISRTNIEFNIPVNNEKFYIKIANNDDMPLDITNIKADYITDKVVFEDNKSGPYMLLFDNVNAIKPVYDISSYIDYIEKEKQGQCELAKINVKNIKEIRKSLNINYKYIFNIVVIIISIILVVFIVLTVLKTSKKK